MGNATAVKVAAVAGLVASVAVATAVFFPVTAPIATPVAAVAGVIAAVAVCVDVFTPTPTQAAPTPKPQ